MKQPANAFLASQAGVLCSQNSYIACKSWYHVMAQCSITPKCMPCTPVSHSSTALCIKVSALRQPNLHIWTTATLLLSIPQYGKVMHGAYDIAASIMLAVGAGCGRVLSWHGSSIPYCTHQPQHLFCLPSRPSTGQAQLAGHVVQAL